MKKLICIRVFVSGLDVGHVLMPRHTKNLYDLIGTYDFISSDIKKYNGELVTWVF